MDLCLGSDLWPAAFPRVLSDTSACALQSYLHFLLCVLLSGEQSVLYNILHHPAVSQVTACGGARVGLQEDSGVVS